MYVCLHVLPTYLLSEFFYLCTIETCLCSQLWDWVKKVVAYQLGREGGVGGGGGQGGFYLVSECLQWPLFQIYKKNKPDWQHSGK